MRVEGYTKKDGTVVQGYERDGGKKAEDAPKTKQSASVAAPDSKISHLIPDEMRVGRRQHGVSKKDKIRVIEAELMSQAESGEEARDVAARIGKEKLREISEKAIAAASKPLVQYSFSEYKDAINPEGKRHDDDVYSSRTDDWLEDKADRYTEHLYDKDGVSYRYEKTLNKYVHPDSKHRDGEEIRYMSPEEVKASGNPVYDISIGAIVDGKVAGTLSDSFGAIDLFVRDGFRGKGIGSELQYIARTANPFYSSGGFSKGGEALAEGTFWRLNGLPKEGPAELQEARAELWALSPLFDEKYEEIVVAAQNKAKQMKGKYSDHYEALEDPEYRDALRAASSSWDTLRDWENSVYKPMAAPIKERIKKIKETPVSEFKKAPQAKSMIRKGMVAGYTKKDGTVVKPYQTSRTKKADEAPRQRPAKNSADQPSSKKQARPKYSSETLASSLESLMSRSGLDPNSKYTRASGYKELPSADVINSIASEQRANKGTQSEEALKSYESLKNEIGDQYEALMEAGLRVEAWKGEGEPYRVSDDKPWVPSSKRMREEVASTGLFKFFMTEKGFGAGGEQDQRHPFLQESPYLTSDGEPMLWNDVFRVVHDAVAHLYGGFSFSTRGEMNGMLSHASTLSRDSYAALFAETFAQNSVYETTGNFADQNVYVSKHVGLIDKLMASSIAKSMPHDDIDSDEPLGAGRIRRRRGVSGSPESEPVAKSMVRKGMVSGYTKKDGTVVKPYQTSRTKKVVASKQRPASSGPVVTKADIAIPQDARVVAAALASPLHASAEHGRGQVYAVGGSVRDHLFGKEPKDFDLATNLPEKEIVRRLEEAGLRVQEKASDTFGVVFVSVDGSDEPIEVAPFRSDEGVADGRRPDSVSFGVPIEEDAKRRDFTMNSLYYDFGFGDFGDGSVIDFSTGVEDIQKGVVRPVGLAAERFREDRFRILRLMRFFSRYNSGDITEYLKDEEGNPDETWQAIQKYGDLVSEVEGLSPISGERIQGEFLNGLKQSVSTEQYLKNYASLGLLASVFPDMNVDEQAINDIGDSKNANAIMAWLLKGNEGVNKSLNALKYPNRNSESVQLLIDAMDMTPEGIHSFMRRKDSNPEISESVSRDLLALSLMVSDDQQLSEKLTHLANYKMPLVSGKELMAEGYKGKEIGIEQKRRAIDSYKESFSKKSFTRLSSGDSIASLVLLHKELLPLQRNHDAVRFMAELEGAMYEINSLEAKSYLASVNTHFWTA